MNELIKLNTDFQVNPTAQAGNPDKDSNFGGADSESQVASKWQVEVPEISWKIKHQ